MKRADEGRTNQDKKTPFKKIFFYTLFVTPEPFQWEVSPQISGFSDRVEEFLV